MPGYRQQKTKKKGRRKKKRPYASVKLRTSALGRAKSTPTKSKSKSKSRSKKIRSTPSKSRKSKSKSVSSRRKRALSKAKTLFPRVMEDPEIEMRYLKEKRKGDDSIYTVNPQLLTGLKTLRDKEKTKIEDLAGILEFQENPVGPVELEDLPHMQGKLDLLGKDDPDAILGQLKCKDRMNYCFKTSPELWKKCREPSIHDRYILPCKMSTIIEKKIRDICEIDNMRVRASLAQYQLMMDELSDEFPCLMEQNIVSFLKRYLSYGNEDKPPLEYRVYFQVKRNIFSEISDMDELVQLEMDTWGKMWKEDEFLDAVNNFIGVERMKEIIERWGSTPRYDLGEEKATRVYQRMKRYQKEYVEGSLTWWITMLNCPPVIPFIPDIQDGIDNRIFQFLLQMEDSFLEIFDGTQFQMRENTWFVYGEGEMNTPNFINGDTYRNWYIDTYGKQPKIKEVLRWLKHGRTREDGVENLINMKNTFVRLGSSRFQRSRLMPDVARISEVEMYRYFEEFIDLLNFATIGRLSKRDDKKLVDIEREFQNPRYERHIQDKK
tara:strand:+ start:2400 stop:4043 length:1644 start_codon:yes stop_codon:yes gene_type:complete